jgi:hypothetical protein
MYLMLREIARTCYSGFPGRNDRQGKTKQQHAVMIRFLAIIICYTSDNQFYMLVQPRTVRCHRHPSGKRLVCSKQVCDVPHSPVRDDLFVFDPRMKSHRNVGFGVLKCGVICRDLVYLVTRAGQFNIS